MNYITPTRIILKNFFMESVDAVNSGLTYEGTAREYYKCASGEHLDVAYYGILRSEWDKRTAENGRG